MPKKLTTAQQTLLDVLPDASAVVNQKGTILAVNRLWKQFAVENGGNSGTYYLGTDYFLTCNAASGESRALASTVARGLLAVLESADEFHCEYPCHSASEKRWFEVIIKPFDLEDERCAIVMHRNITKRKVQQIEIDESKTIANELAALVATSTDAIISFDLDGRVLTWNKAAQYLYGYNRDEIIGQSMETLYPPNSPKRITDDIDEIVAAALEHFEVVRRTKSGALRNIAVSAAPVRNAQGEITAISNIHRDITEHKQLTERQTFITQELTHRTKNMLAVISAIERQTANRANSVEDFHERFSARLISLLASNDLLVATDWAPVQLNDLARLQLSAFLDAQPRNVDIEGPPVLLKPKAVQALGMSFHELATNAVKYGALKQSQGRLRVTWQTLCKNAHRILRIVWEESDLSIELSSDKRGFGHAVLTALSEQSLNADVDYAFHPSGMSWSIEIPDTFFSLAG